MSGALPLGMQIDWDVDIAMSDGSLLRADVFRPQRPGRYPVILACGPYGKGLAFDEGFPGRWTKLTVEHPDVAVGSSTRYANFEVCDPEKWVPDGYVCVRVDSRGAGRSPGMLYPFQARESRDLYESVEWAAVQPWSDGKVGLSGISYLAMNQWHAASLQPPHLAAMIPWEGAADFYRDAAYHGGVRSSFWDELLRTTIGRVQHGIGERGYINPNTGVSVSGPETLSEEELEANRANFRDEMRQHPLDDSWHRERSADWSRITVPLLSAGNWGGHGLHLRGNVEAFMRAASKDKWLEIHGLEHWTHFYTDYGVALQKAFFACFLKGVDNGWRDRPRVKLQIRSPSGFTERDEHEWPLARTQWTKLHLRPADRSLQWDADPEESTAGYEPLSGGGVSFSTAPLERQTEITGPIAVRLYVETSGTDTDLFLVLNVYAPDGTEVVFSGAQRPNTPTGQGWLRASHRKLDRELTRDWRPYHTHDEVQPLTPGQVYPLDIEIWPTCLVIPAGHRIGLTVRGSDYVVSHGDPTDLRGPGHIAHDDAEDRPAAAFGGSVLLHGGGDRDAYVLLPIIPN
jgi:predicted acyl esterase